MRYLRHQKVQDRRLAMVILMVCAHCDREVPPMDPEKPRSGHRVCGGCRQVICASEPDCDPQEV